MKQTFEATDAPRPIQYSVHLIVAVPDLRFQLRINNDNSGTVVPTVYRQTTPDGGLHGLGSVIVAAALSIEHYEPVIPF